MKKLQINGLEMNANSGMVGPNWTDDAGNRFHVWLQTESDPTRAAHRQPLKPYRVIETPRRGDLVPILYMNCSRKPDGTFRNRYDEGYFDTRYLDARAKKNAPVVAEVLRRCEAEGLFEKAKAEAIAAEEKEQRDREDAKVKRLGDAVVKLEAELIEEGNVSDAKRIVDAFAKLPRESMIKFHDIMMRRD